MHMPAHCSRWKVNSSSYGMYQPTTMHGPVRAVPVTLAIPACHVVLV